MDWDEVFRALNRWHTSGDDTKGQAVFRFLEGELRQMVPRTVKQRWTAEEIDDAIASLLKKLVEKPLPPDVSELAPYLRRALRHLCVDIDRARGRRKEQFYDAADMPPDIERALQSAVRSPEATIADRQQIENLMTALQRLDVADRVSLKLSSAPEILDADELAWLASLNATSTAEICLRIQQAEDVHDLTRIFDPGDDSPEDTSARRLRMERFRKRCSRAREKLFGLFEVEE